MSAVIEKLSREVHEDPSDPLSSKALSREIKTVGEALQHPAKLQALARRQQMDIYPHKEIVQHYTNHRRQYQSFYEMLHAKKIISEGEVRSIVNNGRRGRR